MEWEEAEDIKINLQQILNVIELPHVKLDRVFCYRTHGSKARAYARTWGFPKIFQTALDVQPAYVIEVLSRYYDKLDEEKKIKVLIHELLHIPKNFSGALVPHHTRTQHIGTSVNRLFKEYKSKREK
ncbi:MAG TPA: putative metallopeptidase [Patescibacteria group bacterium]|nr:putative metallopeptidase [Patescibacteria group bacterium]